MLDSLCGAELFVTVQSIHQYLETIISNTPVLVYINFYKKNSGTS